MTNNDILRRLRFSFELSDSKMIELFALAGITASRAQISDWLKKDDDPAFVELQDILFAGFLNGFIIDKRGPSDKGMPEPEKRLNNNIVFRKLKIALNLKDDDIIEILKLSDFRIGKHELSAFFRNPTQSQFRPCKDQILRNFLQGLQLKYRKA